MGEKCCTNEPVGVTETGRIVFGHNLLELRHLLSSFFDAASNPESVFMPLCRKYLSLQMLALQLLSIPVCVTPPCSYEHNISGMLEGNQFKFGTNIHLDSWMNWLEFGGQRS